MNWKFWKRKPTIVEWNYLDILKNSKLIDIELKVFINCEVFYKLKHGEDHVELYLCNPGRKFHLCRTMCMTVNGRSVATECYYYRGPVLKYAKSLMEQYIIDTKSTDVRLRILTKGK